MDLTSKYLGLSLRNPIIAASSPLTRSIDALKRCEDAGAGAVVLKSIFEEQIEAQTDRDRAASEDFLSHSDAAEYFEAVSRDYYINQYLELVRKAKSSLSIPVIASINCASLSSWTGYISSFSEAGADAIELNYYPIAADADTEGRTVDKRLVDFALAARKATDTPIAIKIGYKYSSLANIMRSLDKAGVDGIVIFNRFFRPDIDIDTMSLSKASNPLSDSGEYAESLRWTALMSAELGCDICASTGIHDAQTVIKLLLAGAAACQVCSAAVKDINIFGKMADGLSSWMEEKGFSSIAGFRGRLAQERIADGALWERTQYVKGLMEV